MSVEAFLDQDAIAVTVSDQGRWTGDSSASLRSQRRGRGLTLMSGLANQVETVRTRRAHESCCSSTPPPWTGRELAVNWLGLLHRLAELLEEPVVVIARHDVTGGDDHRYRPFDQFECGQCGQTAVVGQLLRPGTSTWPTNGRFITKVSPS